MDQREDRAINGAECARQGPMAERRRRAECGLRRRSGTARIWQPGGGRPGWGLARGGQGGQGICDDVVEDCERGPLQLQDSDAGTRRLAVSSHAFNERVVSLPATGLVTGYGPRYWLRASLPATARLRAVVSTATTWTACAGTATSSSPSPRTTRRSPHPPSPRGAAAIGGLHVCAGTAAIGRRWAVTVAAGPARQQISLHGSANISTASPSPCKLIARCRSGHCAVTALGSLCAVPTGPRPSRRLSDLGPVPGPRPWPICHGRGWRGPRREPGPTPRPEPARHTAARHRPACHGEYPPAPWPPSRGRLAADRPAAATCLSAARPPQLWRLTYALLVGLQPSDRAACLSALAPRQPATPRLHTHAKLPHERLETRDERSCRMRDERLEKLPHERRETT